MLLATGVVLRIIHFPVAVYTPDEDAYVNKYAAPMYYNGLGELPRLVRDYNRRPDMFQFPSPTRVGHLWAMVGMMKLAGSGTAQAAACVSTIASILMLLLIARIGLKFLNPWIAAIALLFAAVSPLDLALARRVWGDDLFALFALATLLALIEYATGKPRARWMVSCLALAGYSILIKESGLLVLGFATAGLAIAAWRASGPPAAARAILAGAITLLASLGVLAVACGGIEPLRATFTRGAAAGRVNDYMLHYQTGGPGYYLRGLSLLQPLPMLLGALGAALVAARPSLVRPASDPRRTRSALAILAWFTIVFAAVALLYPQKNMRFLSPAYAPLDLLAAALLSAAVEHARSRLPRPAFNLVAATIVALLLGAALADHQRFVEFFIRRGIPDLATPWFTRTPS